MSSFKIPLWQVITAMVVLIFGLTAGWYYYRISHRIVWTMVHVSGNHASGDAHLLEFPNGHVVLIDTGFERFTQSHLLPYLDNRGIDHIEQLVITHAHRNHYEGIELLLDRVGTVYFNLPPGKPCEKERRPDGCDYQHVLRARALVEEAGIPLRELHTDDLVYHDQDQDISLEVVYTHDGESPPVGKTDINDTSAILRLVYGTTSALFTGDINHRVGKHLVDKHFFLKTDIMTAPHHGVEGAAPNEFLDAADPEVILVSNSAENWRGIRGTRMRDYAYSHHIPAYITGIHGNVVVLLARDEYEIKTQLKQAIH